MVDYLVQMYDVFGCCLDKDYMLIVIQNPSE